MQTPSSNERLASGNASASDSRAAVRSWPLTLGCLLGMVACLVAAVALWNNDHGFIAGIACFAALILLIYAIMSRKSYCPLCGTPMTVVPGANLCKKCDDYVLLENERLSRIPSGHFFGATCLSLPSGGLRTPSQWQWPFPGRCCVCQEAATKTESVSWSVAVDKSWGMTRSLKYRFEVPHCAQHSEGFKYEIDELKFRSYDYWLSFKELNTGPKDWGTEMLRAGMR